MDPRLLLESMSLQDRYNVNKSQLKSLAQTNKEIITSIKSHNISKVKSLLKNNSKKYSVEDIDKIMKSKDKDYDKYKRRIEIDITKTRGDKYKILAVPYSMLVCASKNKNDSYNKIKKAFTDDNTTLWELIIGFLTIGGYLSLAVFTNSWIIPLVIIIGSTIIIDLIALLVREDEDADGGI